MNRILIVGVPRSGTTWFGRVLAATENTEYLGEPDNPLKSPFALQTSRRLGIGHYPLLTAEASAPEYERLWAHALGLAHAGGLSPLRRRASGRLFDRFSPHQLRAAVQSDTLTLPLRIVERLAAPEEASASSRNLIVKSVYAPLSVEWIARHFPLRIAIVLRNPLSILSSWAELKWLGRPGNDVLDQVDDGIQEELTRRWSIPHAPVGAPVMARAAWMVAAFTCALTDAAARNPDWTVVTHEDLCEAPSERYPVVASALGLTWGARADGVLGDMNRPGEGLEPFRVASDLGDVWSRRLSAEEVEEARSVLDRFPLDERLVSHTP
jgi:Sulfotransferase family